MPGMAPAMASTDPAAPSPGSMSDAAPANMAPAPPGRVIDPTDVAHTFCYIRGNKPETTLQLLHNGQVSYASNEPHGKWAYEWRAQGIEGWGPMFGKGQFFICFNGNPDSDKPPREHVFTQVGDTDAFRLIEQNPAWSVVLIKKN